MISFIIAIVFLFLGYVFYGRFVERNFGVDDRPTPANTINDGVDYVPMPTWKVFLIQLLNIAGTGPIFGALSGAIFGPIVYLWIVLGCVFAGAVHDFMCGSLSIRNNGGSISEITGKYLGKTMKGIMRVFSLVLLIMCGVVFTTGPAGLIALLTPDSLNTNFFVIIILLYYFVATFVPIDKVIGKLYPLFGICLLIMTTGVGGSLMFSGKFTMPEVWDNFSNMHPTNISVFPFMFVTVACGAISGFHATQSPMMARCITSEKKSRQVFYGAMIAEGVIALVWASAGVSCYENSQALLLAGGGCSAVVYEICKSTLGKVGMILAMIGVIVCPISSGDTSYRAARLTLADALGFEQKSIKNRLILTAPILICGAIICQVDYSVVWRYFSFANQSLAMIALWAATVFLKNSKKNYIVTALPAFFMSIVAISYFVCAPECLGALWGITGVGYNIYYPIAIACGLLSAIIFLILVIKNKKEEVLL